MAAFDTLIDDLATRFGLGANARSLVSEVLAMISSSPGGFGGFLDKFKSAGLTSEVASWLGRPDASPMAAGQVERALGAAALSGIAGRLGLAQGAVSSALGYALPKIIGLLTPGGAIPAGIPAEVTAFLSPPRTAAVTEQVAPKRIDVLPASPETEPTIRRWLWPALAALVVVALLSYFWSTLNRMPSRRPSQRRRSRRRPAPAIVAQAPSPPPAPSPAAQAPPRRLSRQRRRHCARSRRKRRRRLLHRRRLPPRHGQRRLRLLRGCKPPPRRRAGDQPPPTPPADNRTGACNPGSRRQSQRPNQPHPVSRHADPTRAQQRQWRRARVRRRARPGREDVDRRRAQRGLRRGQSEKRHQRRPERHASVVARRLPRRPRSNQRRKRRRNLRRR